MDSEELGMTKQVCLLLVCSLLISINIVTAQEATELPDGGLPRYEAGQLLYTLGAEIFVVNSDNSASVHLVNREGNEGCASWMPDGNRIIFAANYGQTPELLYMMNADGSDIQRVTPAGVTHSQADTVRPTADGSQVIWRTRSGDSEITRLVVDVATGEMHESDNAEISRLLSPNGLGITNNRYDIYSIDEQGQETLLTSNSYQVKWSLDGERFAAITFDEETNLQGISVGNSDGSDLTNILAPHYLIDDFAWSPDGQRLALVITNTRDDVFEYLYYIAVLTIETGELVYFTEEGAYLPSEVWWSPDGSKLAYTQGDAMGGHYWLYVIDADGESRTLLTENILNCDTVMWRPG
jgi:Tol biopolymer transport system component